MSSHGRDISARRAIILGFIMAAAVAILVLLGIFSEVPPASGYDGLGDGIPSSRHTQDQPEPTPINA